MGLDIGFTIVTWVWERHGVECVKSDVVMGAIYLERYVVIVVLDPEITPSGTFNEQVNWGEDLLSKTTVLSEHGLELEHAFVEIRRGVMA